MEEQDSIYQYIDDCISIYRWLYIKPELQIPTAQTAQTLKKRGVYRKDVDLYNIQSYQ